MNLLYTSRRVLFLVLILAGNSIGLLLDLALTSNRRRACGRRAARLLEQGGAVFIKAGQILSSRPDLLPVEIADELARLQDNVKPFPQRLLREALVEAFSGRFEDLFAAFDPEPISTGSVAQVYRAELKSGEKVALKLRRPGLVRSVTTDLAIVMVLVRLAAKAPGMALIPIESLAGEIADLIRDQLNLRQEANNIHLFRTAFNGNRDIRIPQVYDHVTSDSVLVMEFCEDLIKIPNHALVPDARSTIITGLRALFQMVFVDGRVHADMHPGNVFLRRNGQFVLLDFGVVARLDGEVRDDFREFFTGLITNDGLRCARVLTKHALYKRPDFCNSTFQQAIVELIGRHSALCAGEFEVTQFAAELFAIQRNAGLRGSTIFTATILSFVVFEGIVKQVDAGLDFQAEALWYLVGQSRKAAYA